MVKLIIIDKSLTMMPFYHPFINFSNTYYNVQNMPTIIPNNSLQNFYGFSNINFLKPQGIQEKITSKQSFQYDLPAKYDTSAVITKISQPSQFAKSQNNSQIQILQNQSQSSIISLKKTKLIEKVRQKQIKRKIRIQKKDKAYVAKQYPKQQPSINCRYIQKNFQLNIINQVFSFLWSQQKSIKYCMKFFNDKIKVTLFYQYIKIVRKFCKRYINKEYLKNLCHYQNHHIAYKMVAKNSQKLQYLSMGEFSKCIRYLIFIYLHQLCPQAILTSRKMRRQIWRDHLMKCRLLRNFMFYNLSSEQYESLLIHSKQQNQKMESTSEQIQKQ